MELGNSNINKLLNVSEKHYENSASNININDLNNSLTKIINCIDKKSIVLDIGCSYGYIGEWLAKNKNCTMYGIEIDEKELLQVRKGGYYKDIYKINLDDISENDSEVQRFLNININFDYIICADVIEHLKSPQKILSKLGQKLKYNGKIIISTPNICNIDIIISLMNGDFNYSNYGILDNTHVKFFTRHSFVEWIYSCNNKYLKNFKFDYKYIGCTTFETLLANKFKTNYGKLYNLLLKNNDEFLAFQNIFSLVKKENDTKCIELERAIKSYRSVTEEDHEDIINTVPSEPLNENIELKYEFICKNEYINNIDVLVGTYNKVINAYIMLTLFIENDTVPILNENYEMKNIEDNSWVYLKFSNKISLKNKKIIIKIMAKTKKEDTMSIWLNKDKNPVIKVVYKKKFDFWKSGKDYSILKNIDSDIKILTNKNKFYDLELKKLKEQNKKLKEENNVFKMENIELKKSIFEKIKRYIKNYIKN